MLEEMNGTRLAAHVTYFAAAPTTVGFEFLGIVFGEFVLESTRQGDVARDGPSFLSLREDALFGELIRHVLYFIAVRRTHDEHVVDHLFCDAIFNGNHTIRTRDCHYFSTEFNRFRGSTPCYVAEARERHFLSLNIFAGFVQEVLREIERAETGSFRTENRTAPGHAFSGEDTCMIFAREFLVHAIEEAYLASTNAHVASGNILIRANATP